ncbi:MAG: DUF2070 family protein [Candidatus Bathyarchaeia archaeon]|nr:DUF2070 family protein [Candidatus Bathyarchaeota archaeon]
MTVDESFNQYLDRAVKHYSSLFKLPSYGRIIALSVFVCLIGGLFSITSLFPFIQNVIHGVLFGLLLFIVTIFLNHFLKHFVLKKDPVYDLRRIATLSLFCWILWIFFILIGFIFSIIFGFGNVWAVRFCLLGFSAVLILRFIVLYVTSSSGLKHFIVAATFPPLASLVPFLFLWSRAIELWRVFFFIVYAFGVVLISSFIFLFLLNNVGKQTVGFPSLSIFRGFLLNWIADLNEPFESFLESLGKMSSVDVSILRFNSKSSSIFVVVPSVHPGPFKNIGSSLLPSMVKMTLEEKFGGVACTPLGLLGHELDLASQKQSQKIINHVVESADFIVSDEGATQFVKVRNELATVCCQIFGGIALMSFSLAPNTTEDLSSELGSIIRQEALKRGLNACIFVNAHNSINGTPNQKEALKALKEAAIACLNAAASSSKAAFKIGAATVKPKDFHLVDGMGPGGITVLVVEVLGRKAAYVVLDGNNMVSGLREKILSALQSLGFEDGEVFTTDTHSVNAVTLNARGYHPIGEVMDHEKLINYVNEAARLALEKLEKAKVGFRSVTVDSVKVIGREALEKLCVLPDMVLRRAKRVVVPIFAVTFTLLMLFLLLI